MATNPLGQALQVFDWTSYFQNLLNNSGMNVEGEPEKEDPEKKKKNPDEPSQAAKDTSTENLERILDFARGTKTGFSAEANDRAKMYQNEANKWQAWDTMWSAMKNEANNPKFDPAAHAQTRQWQQFAGIDRPVGRTIQNTDLPNPERPWTPSSMPGGGVESMIDPRAENPFADSNYAQIFAPETPNQLFGPRIIDNGVGVNPDGTPWRDPGLVSNATPIQTPDSQFVGPTYTGVAEPAGESQPQQQGGGNFSDFLGTLFNQQNLFSQPRR